MYILCNIYRGCINKKIRLAAITTQTQQDHSISELPQQFPENPQHYPYRYDERKRSGSAQDTSPYAAQWALWRLAHRYPASRVRLPMPVCQPLNACQSASSVAYPAHH
jgi:hypothetical protein